ncbi:MAG: hypothetical protein AAGF84_05995 [Planctomycetota bacterium]
MTSAASQWFVRLGAAKYGPMPWSTVREKRDAGLFSRWHEVSEDGALWLPIDDAAPEHLVPAEVHDEASDESAVDWNAFAERPAGPAPLEAYSSTGTRFADLRVVTCASAAGLWLVLAFVPVAWRDGGVWFWSWSGGWAGVGLAVAQAWWLLVGLAVALVPLVWREPMLGNVKLSTWVMAMAAPGVLAAFTFGTSTVRIVVIFGIALVAIGMGLLTLPKLQAIRVEQRVWLIVATLSVTLLGFAWWWGGAQGLIVLGNEVTVSARTQGVLVAVYLISHAALALTLRQPLSQDVTPT